MGEPRSARPSGRNIPPPMARRPDMGRVLALITALFLLFPVPGSAQDSRAALATASKALGADGLKTLQYSASGVNFAIGQSQVPGAAWPRFNIPTFTRSINYETASL